MVIIAVAAAADTPTTVYFGSGCFWERQFSYAWNVELGNSLKGNNTIFGRNEDTVTAVVGYAGSKRVGPKAGRVCYHNDESSDDDYGTLGHAEAVRVTLDSGKEEPQYKALIENFFVVGEAGGHRPDPGDGGQEYRSFLGLPGGVKGSLYPLVVAANKAAGNLIALKEGKGEEQDEDGTAWVYDSAIFPFHRGEPYHQFHSNFAPPAYPNDYLDVLWKRQIALGRINSTGCPTGQHFR
jgi:peptide methionine sulfoxide reductase MsrA